MAKHLLWIFFFLLCAGALRAQTDTEFWFAAPEITNAHADRPIYVRISSFDQTATVTLSQPAYAGFDPITVTMAPNSSRSVNLTSFINLLENTEANTIANKGLFIKSTSPVTCYYEVLGTVTQPWTGNRPMVVNCDIFTLKGRNALGKKFYTPFQNYWSNQSGINASSSFDIVATENATTVTITPTQDIEGHAAGIPFTIVLNKGQTYSARAIGTSGSEHLSGSLIVADKPIAVTLKDDSLLAGSNWDMAGDQIVPVDLTGTEYIAIKGSGPWLMDRIFVCATENNTEVFLNGANTPVAVLQEGQTYAYALEIPVTYITSSKPVYVFHISCFISELAGALLPPVGCTGSQVVRFIRPTDEQFAINLVVKSGGENYFKLNGRAVISAAGFSTVPGTNGLWKAAQLKYNTTVVPAGSATEIRNDSADFHLGILNGGDNTGFRYGYFSDYGVIDLGEDWLICKGDSLRLNAGYGMTSYLWNTNETSQFITVRDTGLYSVEIEKGNCILKDTTDSLHVGFHPDPRKVLAADTTVCSNTGYAIEMDTLYSRYQWLNGSTASELKPSSTGIYWVDVWNEFGCRTRDSISVIVNPAPEPVITFNTDLEKICWDSTITLDAGPGYTSYRWHNGATTQQLTTKHLEEYFVVVSNNFNCTDSVNLYIDCSPYVRVFNLITPNGDALNDVFYVEGLKSQKWILEVYSRWGEQVYYNRSYNNEFNASHLSSGIYYYNLRHVEEKKIYKGWLHVVKED